MLVLDMIEIPKLLFLYLKKVAFPFYHNVVYSGGDQEFPYRSSHDIATTSIQFWGVKILQRMEDFDHHLEKGAIM